MPRTAPLLLALAMALTFDLAHPSPAAAQARPHSAAEVLAGIEKLGVLGRVLYVAAHPDDENTRLLAYLANERKVRAAYLSLTRGDGGQNLIGAEQGPLLGLIRTQELLAARRVDGAEQFFTRARDFGYSKSPEETLRIWDQEAVLADMVRVIREFRPDVIVTRFPTRGLETHGHHTASAILAERAFALAADAGYQPELGAPWKVTRIAWNKSSFFIKPGEDLSAFHKLDIGAFNALLGESYGEMAARSRSMHKSQGFGAANSRGESLEYFQVTGGAPIKGDLLDGVELGWRRLGSGGDKVTAALKAAHDRFRADRPWEVVPQLVAVRGAIAALPESAWRRDKLAEVEWLMVAASGLFLEATGDGATVVPGGSMEVTASVLPRTPAAVRVVEVSFRGGTPVPIAAMPAPNGKSLELKQSVPLPADRRPDNPYWLEDPPAAGLYAVRDPALIGRPESRPRLLVAFKVAIAAGPGGKGEITFPILRPVVWKWVDPVAGERVRHVEVAPAVTLHADAPVMMFAGGMPRALRVRLTFQKPVPVDVKLEAPAGFVVLPSSLKAAPGPGNTAEVTFNVTPPPGAASGTLRLLATSASGETFDRDQLHIDHGHIPIQALYPAAQVKLVRFDLAHARTRIGYIPGAGDEVAEALRQVGYEVTVLPGDTLGSADLSRFEALVIGVRAFNTVAALDGAHNRLMDYVERGGVIVAQYSTANRISKVPPLLGPYPFDLSQERVTDENAEVAALLPAHPTLAAPNRIGPADWQGWVQERGLYFAGKWDERYEAPLGMNDPGEPQRKGSLLVARHGKGAFLYTGLSFFRQLPAGVPGAYRLFANLIDYGVTAPVAGANGR